LFVAGVQVLGAGDLTTAAHYLIKSLKKKFDMGGENSIEAVQ
jgi:hypothetical protein